MDDIAKRVEERFTDQYFEATRSRNDKRREAITALIQEAVFDGRLDELNTIIDSAALNNNPGAIKAVLDRIKELSGGSNNE